MLWRSGTEDCTRFWSDITPHPSELHRLKFDDSQYVRFEVCIDTKLLWDVSYDNSSSDHVFTGRLLTASGSPVGGKNMMISLNDTNVVNCTTDGNGWFVFRRHFDAGESTITYNVQATFEGTGSQMATLNSTSFDGENYTVCTVTYFSFKPSANMTTVTVEPHATEVKVPCKSPA